MKNQWLYIIILYASIVTDISFSLLYVALNNWNSNRSSYGGALNALSQQIFSNKTYEDTVEWMFRSNLVSEENITLQGGYALGWDYYEAQTCAARNLVGLQRWATSLDFGVVEPFVIESFFRSYRFTDDEALRLSDYFDIIIR